MSGSRYLVIQPIWIRDVKQRKTRQKYPFHSKHWRTVLLVNFNFFEIHAVAGESSPYSSLFLDRSIFRSNFPGMRLPSECYDQSRESNRRPCVTWPELPFFHKRKGILKIDQSEKMPWHSMGVASSYSSAPVQNSLSKDCNFIEIPSPIVAVVDRLKVYWLGQDNDSLLKALWSWRSFRKMLHI